MNRKTVDRLLALISSLVLAVGSVMMSIYAAHAASDFVPPPQCYTDRMLGTTSYCTPMMRNLSWAAGAVAVFAIVVFLLSVLVVVVERFHRRERTPLITDESPRPESRIGREMA